MADQLRFAFLGTGAPPVSLRRAGPAHLVSGAGLTLLIDCGAGVAHQLAALGQPAASVDALIVTHRHSDHLVDFYQLVVSSWHQGRDRPWRVIAPEPALAVMRAQYAAFADERALRIAHEKRASSTGLDVAFEALAPGPVPGLEALSVAAFLVDHRPVEPAFGLSFAAAGARVVFSGDTRPCDGLAQAAQGADLLVCEMFVTDEMRPAAGVRTQATIDAVRDYHITPQDAARLAQEAGVGALALTHIVPPGADSSALFRAVRAGGYQGPLIVAEDLMALTVPERLMSWRGLSAAF
jgi:ribonuclease BN (tRNA processing enzyme)